MTTVTKGAQASASATSGIAISALIGAVLIFFAGFAQSDTLHDAAHDVRHATGFPCH